MPDESVLDTVNSLCTLAELKLFIGIDAEDSSLNTQLEEYINAASWTLKQETKRILVAQAVTEYLDGNGSNKLMLHEYPVNSVTSLHSDSARTWGDDSKLATADYQVYTNIGMIIVTAAGLDVGEQVIKVVYNAGHSTVPYDLKMACIEFAAYLYEKFKSHRVGLKSVSNTAGSDVYAEDVPGIVKMAIKRYQRKVAI